MGQVAEMVTLEYSLANILSERLKGKSLQAIGDIWGVSHSAISKKLNNIFKLLDKDNLQAYQKNKVSIFTAVEAKLLQSALEPHKLKKMSTRDGIVGFGIVYDKNRLEQDLSTENIAIKDMSADLIAKQTQAKDQLEKLKAELNNAVNKPDDVDK